MISLAGLMNQKAFGKFEMGKVISNPFATAFIKEAEGEDHEVSMGQNQLDTIIKMATELKAKMGENEKEIPAWIQDHISKAENYISQASSNYHEYGDSNESVNEDAPIYKDWDEFVNPHYILVTLKNGKKLKIEKKNVKGGTNVYHAILKAFNDNNHKITNKVVSGMLDRLGESVNEACWKGYKQVGMKDKGGKQVPNCVPNESVVKEGRSVGSIQRDYFKTIDAIQKELALYKKHKDTPQAKKHVENLKKLNVVKNKLQNELDDSLYDDPLASKAKTAANKDIAGNYGPYNYDFD
jgi:hypothetical protein